MSNQRFLKFKIIIISLANILVQISLQAETVILRSHEVIHGKISYQDALVLRMNDDSGKPFELQKNDILKVSYRDVKDAKEIKRIIEEEESKLPPEKRKKIVVTIPENRYTLLFRSAALPGWGQWKAGNKWYAAIAFVGVLGAAGYAFSSFKGFKASEDSYEQNSLYTTVYAGWVNSQPTATPDDKKASLAIAVFSSIQNFGPYSNASTIGNNAIQGPGIVYALQLAHSFYLGYKWEKNNPNAIMGKKAVFGDWKFNAHPRQAYTPTGVTKETYYEIDYTYRF